MFESHVVVVVVVRAHGAMRWYHTTREIVPTMVKRNKMRRMDTWCSTRNANETNRGGMAVATTRRQERRSHEGTSEMSMRDAKEKKTRTRCERPSHASRTSMDVETNTTKTTWTCVWAEEANVDVPEPVRLKIEAEETQRRERRDANAKRRGTIPAKRSYTTCDDRLTHALLLDSSWNGAPAIPTDAGSFRGLQQVLACLPIERGGVALPIDGRIHARCFVQAR